jgi:replicative DNA helicase
MTVDKPETDSGKIYEALKKWLSNRGVEFYEGNRNNYLFQLASACNRFGVPRSDAQQMMRYDFVHGGTQFSEREHDQIMDSTYGRYSNQFGTAAFERSEIVEKETHTVISEEVLEMEAPARDLISLSDVRGDMDRDFRRGIQKGETTYYPQIDNHFRWSRGELTVMHGYGNHGKSAFMNQLIQVKAMKEDQRWCYFSPEQYPPTDFYFDFIQTYQGQTVMKGTYQMTEDKYNEAADWVKDHIYYIYPEKENPTPDYILARFKEMIIKNKIDGVVVDPFNQLYHDYSERDDKYLSKILTEFKRFALLNKVYFVVIAHPSGGAISLDQLGNYTMPYYTKISGGMMWGNKCDNVLAYNRPYYRTDPSNTECHFASQKIKKQSRNGIPGTVVMHYDRDAYRFFQEDGFNPLVEPVSNNWWE